MEIRNFSSSVEKYFTSERGEDNVIFSHVKISSFRAKAHLVFHWCLYNKKNPYPYVEPMMHVYTFMIEEVISGH